jgi:cystathionine beta-lyase/cystathionine gamma-synthase
VLLALCSAGGHVVAQAALYGGTYGVLTHILARFGVEVTFVDGRDVDAVRRAIGPRTSLVWAETIANPTTAVADLPGLAAVARDAGVALVVDSTFASPAVCRPLAHGADLVVHSATKYLGGHGDATGGVVVGSPEAVAPVRAARIDLGGALAPDEAFLLHRGLATLPLRVERQCASAAELAARLARHPAVWRVDHPSLPAHPEHDLAGRIFDAGTAGTRCGGVLTVTVPGGRDTARRFCDGLRLAEIASSLGATRTKVSPVASTTHRQLDDVALAAAGIDPGAVRISVGLEDSADLAEDLESALASL